MKEPFKILVLVPARTARGGITNYYYSLEGKFSRQVDYFTRGARRWPARKGAIAEFFRMAGDVLRFFFTMLIRRYDLVQTTTSFSKNAIRRDSLFIYIAKFFGAKVIVFFRGWFYPYSDEIISSQEGFIKRTYFKADAMIDLGQYNADLLKKWGYTKPVYLETTLVDESLVKEISPGFIHQKYTDPQKINILFLSRVEKGKGIYIVLEAYRKAKAEYDRLRLIISGDGTEDEQVKQYIIDNLIPDVEMTGFISGDKKKEVYSRSHIYILPTLLTEGMSNAVLEALAFGLPLITRPMGGNAGILEDKVNGFLTMSEDPEEFAILIRTMAENPLLMENMALHNYRYASEKFYSSIVARRLEKIYDSVMMN